MNRRVVLLCDVCRDGGARDLTPEERLRWPDIARWVKRACSRCRKRFDRNARKWAA